jgi:hypothetical protein
MGYALRYPFEQTEVKIGGIPSSHGNQNSIIAALERNMKMSAQAVPESVDNLVRNLSRLYGTQTYPGRASHCEEGPYHVSKCDSRSKIGSIGPDMDTGQHNFRTSRLDHAFEFAHHVTGKRAPRITACKRNNAIGTSVIAPVLDLQESPRPVQR